jgi:hypothetical protein
MGRLLASERVMTASRDHVVAGLIEKRRELGGIIDQLQRQLDQHRADLIHIDGVLRVLATDLGLRHDQAEAHLSAHPLLRPE